MSFQDKVVIVTGASSGIGAAAAVLFAQQGAKLAIVGRKEDKLNQTAQKCSGNALTIIADVSSEDDVRRIVDKTIEAFGKIDVLVNNAGIVGASDITSSDALAAYDRIMSVNMRPVVQLTSLCLPHLIKTKGNIVSVSSISSSIAVPYSFAYCTSKATMDHFTRCIALDLHDVGVRVNCVNPGPVATDFIANIEPSLNDPRWFNTVVQTIPTRFSEPAEIGELILYLAGDKAVGITGSCIVTDNGFSLTRSFGKETAQSDSISN